MPIAHDTSVYERNLPHLEKPGKTYFVTFCTWKSRSFLQLRDRLRLHHVSMITDRNIGWTQLS
jgi:hypothetical protein